MRYPTDFCKNCKLKFRKDYSFCPHCGQQAKDKLTVGLLFYNTVTNYFSFDARFFKSVYPLLFKPGYLAKLFVNGQRATFLHPAQLYLFTSILFFFLMTTLVISDNIKRVDVAFKNPILFEPKEEDTLDIKALKGAALSEIHQLNEQVVRNKLAEENVQHIKTLDTIAKSASHEKNLFSSKELDSLIKENVPQEQLLKSMGMKENANSLTQKFYAQILKLYKQKSGGSLLQTIYETLPFALFVLLPVFALLLKMFFFRQGVYVNHLVFSFYFFSFLFFIFTLLLIVNQVVNLPLWIDLIVVLSMAVYLILAIKRFYLASWSTTLLKTGVILFFYFSLIVPATIIILFLYGILVY
jgi:hypothetical protein